MGIVKCSLVSLFVISGLFGCAKAKYYNLVPPTSGQSGQSLSADCTLKFVQNDLCMQWFFVNGVPKSQENTEIILKIFRPNYYDNTVVYVDPVADVINVVLWMPSMGHGSVPTIVERVDVGTYKIKRVNFIMKGPWDLYFQIQKDGVTEQVTASVVIVE